jgi:hypothetical protein
MIKLKITTFGALGKLTIFRADNCHNRLWRKNFLKSWSGQKEEILKNLSAV